MKKLALLIGNSRGLAGSSKDMLDFYTHLTSLQGGAWDPSTEIIPLLDEPASKILDTLSGIRGCTNT